MFLLVLAYADSPGQEATKRLCVCHVMKSHVKNITHTEIQGLHSLASSGRLINTCLWISNCYLVSLTLYIPYATVRYDTRCYFNVRSKADISQLNLGLPHGTDN